jgi:hypothetical protein
MLGVGLNAVDAVLSAFAPDSVKGMFGLSDYVRVDGMSGVGEYFDVAANGPALDDEIALSEYISVGEMEEELGDMQEELGMEEELGAGPLDRAYLGGVPTSALMRQIPHRQMLQPIPNRSFTKAIPAAGSNFDSANGLYRGIFDGGF